MSDNIVTSMSYVVIDDYPTEHYLREDFKVWVCEVDIAKIHRTVLHLVEPEGAGWNEKPIGIRFIGESSNQENIVEFSICNRSGRNRYYVLYDNTLANSYPHIEPKSLYGVFRNNNGDGTVVDAIIEDEGSRLTVTQNYLPQTENSKNVPYTASANDIDVMTLINVSGNNPLITLPSVGIPVHSHMQFKCSQNPDFEIAGGIGILKNYGSLAPSSDMEVIADVYYRSIDPLEIEVFWLNYTLPKETNTWISTHYVFSDYAPNYNPGITEVSNIRGLTLQLQETGFSYEVLIVLDGGEDPYSAGDVFFAVNLQNEAIGIITLLGKVINLDPKDTVQIVFVSEEEFIVNRF